MDLYYSIGLLYDFEIISIFKSIRLAARSLHTALTIEQALVKEFSKNRYFNIWFITTPTSLQLSLLTNSKPFTSILSYVSGLVKYKPA